MNEIIDCAPPCASGIIASLTHCSPEAVLTGQINVEKTEFKCSWINKF